AGGGQLDDVWGGFLGHPYVLRRWSRIARQVGASFYVASVGTGTLSAASRLVVKQALAAAGAHGKGSHRAGSRVRPPDQGGCPARHRTPRRRHQPDEFRSPSPLAA